ncbi:hypothetical protein QYE76_020054 [Lolium multiflorum]|uniref:Uncharacterized protein n=1 Tax=Lolium multiflorum TaxID=4521 RepID=A0AAD8VNU4_LOLMU|nr:hypothetical protein QYE76_020054 [Lolium multiflorum]
MSSERVQLSGSDLSTAASLARGGQSRLSSEWEVEVAADGGTCIAAECENKVRSVLCGEPGHISRGCKRLWSASPPVARPSSSSPPAQIKAPMWMPPPPPGPPPPGAERPDDVGITLRDFVYPKPQKEGIAEEYPRQLASSVGKLLVQGMSSAVPITYPPFLSGDDPRYGKALEFTSAQHFTDQENMQRIKRYKEKKIKKRGVSWAGFRLSGPSDCGLLGLLPLPPGG